MAKWLIFFTDFFTDQQLLPTFFFLFLILILSSFRQLQFSGDIPFPFLVVKESKCLKNNNAKVGYSELKFWKCYIKSGLVNLFASTYYNLWTQQIHDYNWERTFYSQ